MSAIGLCRDDERAAILAIVNAAAQACADPPLDEACAGRLPEIVVSPMRLGAIAGVPAEAIGDLGAVDVWIASAWTD